MGGTTGDSRWPVALVLLAALLVPLATYRLTREAALSRLDEAAQIALTSRALTLDSILDRQRAVAAVLAVDRQVIDTLRAGGRDPGDQVSAKMDLLRAETQSDVIYLLDVSGRAVAASNWDQPASFVGYDYGFRRYFQQAMAEGTGQEYGLGTVSGRPGLYLAHDVRDDGRDGDALWGVVVVKVEFDALEAAWGRDPAGTHVLDAAGRVLISGRPALRFQPLPPDSGTRAISMALRGTDWRLVMRSPTAGATRLAGLAAGTALLAVLLAGIVLALYLARRRRAARVARADAAHRADLERAVGERTRDLSDEMRTRRAAEQRLVQLQSDLVQANKLATLGQVTAGFAHEVNQPLATIRLLAENGRHLLGDGPLLVRENLDRIIGMTDRIGQITRELRSFSRKATGTVQAVSLQEAIQASLMLTASRRRAVAMAFDLPDLPPGLCVRAEAVRLEQILVNLLTNAHDAQEGRAAPRIAIAVETTSDSVALTIRDDGPGLSPGMAAQLFTPFATDKPQGLGLGLVISREIARDFGGELDALPPVPGRGAAFRLTLPRAA
ncbi:ATP-binding protein [Paracoccus nototheniae]|uniref:histidine kinase n=1 Tax=Paracoccus nototheniae TaxID=2489002 RepID=A0ABW4DV08_9RHOB|nr:ATP-binding protein [Paracoccus nototheniae]